MARYALVGAAEFAGDLKASTGVLRTRAEHFTLETVRRVKAGGRARAPRDRGDLQDAIDYTGRGLSYRVGIRDVTIPSRGGTNTAHQNPWVYGVWYEYGFITRRIPAQPFMGPAADAEDEAYANGMSGIVRSTLGAR